MSKSAKKTCKGCEKLIPSTGNIKFCSYKCKYATYLSKARAETRRHLKNAKCRNCNREIHDTNRRIYCSDICYVTKQHEVIREYQRNLRQLRSQVPVPKTYCDCCPTPVPISNKARWCQVGIDMIKKGEWPCPGITHDFKLCTKCTDEQHARTGVTKEQVLEEIKKHKSAEKNNEPA